jgi:hypothetical protein
MAETNEEKHQETYAAAEAALRALDPIDVARRAEVTWDPEASALAVPAFGGLVRLSWPHLTFTAVRPAPMVASFPWRLMALHYLATATGEPSGEEWVSYRDLPDGLFYANTVTREVEEPLARLYGNDPEGFLTAGAELGGTELRLADTALMIHPFPRVPLVFALWREDEEFPAKVKVLYERRGAANLPLQDLRIVAELAGGVLLQGRNRPGEGGPPDRAASP